tara:strand:- start:83847 stop:83996 length:150 start_codon:yes stop_codon:yes gene_type:complete
LVPCVLISAPSLKPSSSLSGFNGSVPWVLTSAPSVRPSLSLSGRLGLVL